MALEQHYLIRSENKVNGMANGSFYIKEVKSTFGGLKNLISRCYGK